MAKKKDNDNWEQLNDMTNYIAGKIKRPRIMKIILTTFISLIMIVSLVVSIFYIALTMESAFNTDDFKEKSIPEESVIVDMDNVSITNSDKNLRLPYFEEEAKKQVFAILTKTSWWGTFLSTNINDYEFTYYKTNSNEIVDKSLIQNDGFTKFDLKIKLKSSFIQFKIPMLIWIKNTGKFYEKFMNFNQFEGKFTEHISPKKVDGDPYLPEQWYHGYLPNNFYYSMKIDNTSVYNTIKTKIDKFTNDYQEEFADNTKIFPIISTIALPDIDLNDITTIQPYYQLIKQPQKYYVGNAAVGNVNEYVNLYSYSGVATSPQPFYITYVSNPNIVDDLIKKAPTSINDVVAFLKNNALDFVPFSRIQVAKDDSETMLKYSPAHTLLTTDNSGNIFQYQELVHYFAFTNSITNSIIIINSNDFLNIGALEKFLQDKYWKEMYDFAKHNFNFFSLHYPDPTVSPEDNWKNVMQSLVTFQDYFQQALKVSGELTSFTFLDINGKDLLVTTDDVINTNDIKKIRFHVGEDLTSGDFMPQPHSFNFTFKVNWLSVIN